MRSMAEGARKPGNPARVASSRSPRRRRGADPLEVKVGVLRIEHSRETVSILDIPPADDFIAGAKMAMADDNTTGKFLDQSFSVETSGSTPDDDAVAAARTLLDKGVGYLIVDLPADALLKVADEAKNEARSSSTPGRPTIGCASRIAAPTSSTSPRRARCWPTGSRNI